MDGSTEALIGLGLFVASELIGMSKLRSNGVIQLVLDIAQRAFPYELVPKGRRELVPKGRREEPEAPARRTSTRRRRQ